MSHGVASTQTDGLILNRVYQTTVATTKIEQIMYRSVAVWVLEPVSNVSWKEVYTRCQSPFRIV
jgi:hypothetical protein